MASFPIFGTGGLWKAASGTGTPSDPFVPAVNLVAGGGSGFPLTGNADFAGYDAENVGLLTADSIVTKIATTIVAAGALTVGSDNPIDTSGGAFAVTYPDPSTWAGQFILIRDAGAAWGVVGDALTITCFSGTKLAGLTNTDFICNLNGGFGVLYSDNTNVHVSGNLKLPPQRLVSGAAGAVVLSDCGPSGQGGTILMLDNSTPRNLVLPANGTIPVPIGYEVYCIQQGSAQVTWTVTSDTLNGSGGLVASKGQWAVTGARKDAATHWVIFGDRA